MIYNSLSAQNKIEETGKRLEPLTQIMLGLKETFSDFLQRSISAVDSKVSDPQATRALIKSFIFKMLILNAKKRLLDP